MNLKRIFIVVFTLLSINVQAQNFDAGFSLGIAATQVDGDSYGGFDKAGPVVGIWVSRNFHSNCFGRMELRYAQKGSYAKTSEETSSYYRIRLHYFEIPLFIGYRFVNGFQAIAGLSLGYLGRAQEMTDLGSFPDEDIEAFKKYEMAGIGGVEYNYSECLAIGAYCSYSILPIRPHRGNITYRLDKGQYNQVLELIVRYKL
ncbi:MAG: porin family protein [Bacteroidales bacterium]